MSEEARLKGKLTLDDSQFEAVLRRSSANAAKFAGSVGRTVGAGAAVGFAALTTAAAGASVALANATKRALDLGGQFADMRSMTGASVKSLTLLSQAFDDADIGGENIAATLNKMQKSIEAGGDAFKDLGLDLEKLKRLSPEEQFAQIGNAIAALKTPSQQTAAAMEIFGKSGGKLLTFFKDSAALENAKTVLGSMPEILDRNAEKFDAMSDKIGNMTKKWDAFGVGFADKIAPALDPILDKLMAIDTAKIGQGLGKDIASAFSGQDKTDAIADLGGRFVKIMAAAAKSVGQIILGSLMEAFNEPLIAAQAKIEFLAAKLLRLTGGDKSVDVDHINAEIERAQFLRDTIGVVPFTNGEKSNAIGSAMQDRIDRLTKERDEAMASGNASETEEQIRERLRNSGGARFGFGEGSTAGQMIKSAIDELAQTGAAVAPATTAAVNAEAPKVAAAGKPIPTGFDAASPAYKAQLIGFYGSEEEARKQFESPPAASPREEAIESPMRQPSVKGADGVRATVGRVERKNKILSGEALKKAKDAEAAAKAQLSTAEGVNKIATILEGK